MARGCEGSPPHNRWASDTICFLKVMGHWSSGVLIFLPSIDVSLLEWKKGGRLEGFWKKKKGGYSRHFVKGGKLWRKGPPVGGEGVVNVALSGGSFSRNLVLALAVQCKLSPLVLAGFSALGPEPQQIGAYLPIHPRPGSSLIGLLATPFTGGHWQKGFQPLEEGREKKTVQRLFSHSEASLVWKLS